MDIITLIDQMLKDVIASFEDDGMTIKMPDDVKAKLKEEMTQRLCDTYNDIRDDIETDVRGFAYMPEEN